MAGTRRVLVVSVAAVLLWPALGFGQSWKESFPDDRMGGELVELEVMVVAADDSAGKPATAFADALRQAGSTSVMDDEALGDVSGLSDAQILDRAKGYPFERLAVVRTVHRAAGPGSEEECRCPGAEASESRETTTEASGDESDADTDEEQASQKRPANTGAEATRTTTLPADSVTIVIYTPAGDALGGFLAERGHPVTTRQARLEQQREATATVETAAKAVQDVGL